MNSITLIKGLMEKRNQVELQNYLRGVWNQVWTDDGELSYANLRLFKVADKIKNLSQMGRVSLEIVHNAYIINKP